MEIVLLWLDDLDDLVFYGAGLWTPLRRFCLQVGLAASVSLLASELSAATAHWAPTLAAIAAWAVIVWFAGAAFALSRLLKGARSAFA
jgi:hypothetical protein